MKSLAAYAMRGRMQAASISSLFAVLSLILPPLSYISGAIISLVTLRRGIAEGAVIALIAALVLAALSQVATGSVLVAGVFTLLVWLPVWILSVTLRQTVSLSISLSVATAICMAAVVLFHALIGNTIEWWRSIIDKLLTEAANQPGMLPMGENAMLQESTVHFMTGFMATAFFISMVLSLFLGRWWQAALYNPGGFKVEFHQFRLDKYVAVLGSIVLLWAMIISASGSLASDLSVVVCVYASVAGIALIHYWVEKTGSNKAWLFLLYLLLAFVAPHVIVFLAIVGFADAWLDIRRFIATSKD